MPRQRSPDREKARALYMQSDGTRTLRDIAVELGVSEKTISAWKCKDNWDKGNGVLRTNKRSTSKKRGAPKGNKNARGSHDGAPKGNQNAVVTGEYMTLMFSAFDPEQTHLAALTALTDKKTHLEWQLQIATVREKQQLDRLATYQNASYQNASKGMMVTRVTHEGYGKTTVIENNADRIQRCEDSLTRTQDLIRKLVAELHRIEVETQKLELEKDRHSLRRAQAAEVEESASAPDFSGLTIDELRQLAYGGEDDDDGA